MRHTTVRLTALLPAALLLCGWGQTQGLAAGKSCSILQGSDAAALEKYAAREVRRYIYLRAGQLLPIEQESPELAEARQECLIVVGRKDGLLARTFAGSADGVIAGLQPQQYLLKTIRIGKQKRLLVVGGDELGTLYAAYRLAEQLGVRFYLHGDVVPDRQASFDVPELDEVGRPLFTLRGIQPFHDFPEGPDWWNRDDYFAVLGQLPKLRMNFFGLHTYPEKRPNAEPTVWIGLPADVGDQGRVAFSYPASYQNTLRGNWGYAAKKTSAFSLGAAQLFERDDFGAEVMWDLCPEPEVPESCNAVFERTAALLRDAFTRAQQLGIKTCVGTETPLVVPKRVQERLKAENKDPADPAVIQELYTGIFQRVTQAYPLDYYWFWTPEGWTWESVKDEQIQATTNDLLAAVAAHRELAPPFGLATCGWVLGPPQDRAFFDKVLPAEIALSCINRQVGQTPVDPGFARVSGRGKWAIPWLEDDPALTSPQLWVGRMRRDARDARRYGCDGLMGIHWRTRILGPAASALAQAAWDQEVWNQTPDLIPEAPLRAGPVGGKHARFPDHPIADTELDPVYQTVRYDVAAYHFALTNGTYQLTLRFCEPHYKEPGKRVFGVKIQGQPVLEGLDIFAKVGQDRALDFDYDNIAVTNGWLDIDFVPLTEYPSIAGISLRGQDGYAFHVNCGGTASADYQADWPESSSPQETFPPTDDFYQDWAWHLFGEKAGPEIAAIFAKLDGQLPRPSDWVNGPGGIRPDPRPWSEVEPQYAFVDTLAALRKTVRGAGSRERFDWWLNTFRYMRAMARVNCSWAQYTNTVAKVASEPDPDSRKQQALERVLPLRRQLVTQVSDVLEYLLATISNPGELGTLANWEQHLLPDLLEKPGRELAKWIGEDLPPDAQLPKEYAGPTRVIVPARRTSYQPREALSLKVIVLASQPPRKTTLRWRRMGQGRFGAVPLEHVARGVYRAVFPPQATADDTLEYYLEVIPAQGKRIRFPATAPDLNETLVAGP